MAGRIVLEAAPNPLLSAIASKLKKLVGTADDAAKLAGSAESILLIRISNDAEARRRPVIKDWLHAFQKAKYELDDALDGYNGCVARRQQQPQEAGRSILRRFRSSATVANEDEYKKLQTTVEELDDRMDKILQEGVLLGLQPIDLKRQSWISKFPWDPTPNNDTVGDIEHEKLNIVSMLTDSQSTNHVVVMVGCGGTGKTTLARAVFDDYQTRNAFNTLLWVCASKDLTDVELLSAIASATGFKTRGAVDKKKIEEMLAFMLGGKRFLLVLDDVWSHQVHENFLKTCLHVQHGSRILMTTRDKGVAGRMGSAVRIVPVQELVYPACWSLLSRIACLDAKQCKDLKGIGITIIQKCSRIPLAIQVIGGVLRTKDPTLQEWFIVSDHEGWSTRSDIVPDDGMMKIAGPIHVAYCDLPPYLKQCFHYCLHLPEGFMISKHIITQLWISEGFIEEQDGCSLEDTATEYYKELVLRNLLQPEIGSLDMTRCTINGCVRSVLQLFTKDLWIGKSRSASSTSRVERATWAHLRTVILYMNPWGDRVLDHMAKNIKSLRVLDLTGTEIRHIPGSLEPLLHLRFLNLSHTEIMELPESIERLRNLQFLILRSCYRLHSLPHGISKLQNLRTLDLEGSEPHLVLPRLSSLQQLTTLHGFVVNSKEATEKDTSGWPLEDLNFLNSLRSLQIVKMDRIQQHLSAQRAALSKKLNLAQLELCGSTRKVHEVEETEASRLNDVLSSLRPPNCLESLKILRYYGLSFPNWILQLPSLQRLVIADCKYCESLLALGELPQLKLLEISGCSKVRAVERGRTGPPQAFPKLEQLHINDMQSFESWKGFEDGDLPSLVELHLQRCSNLRSLPSCLGHSKLLTSMLIISVDSLEDIVSLPALRELVVQDSEKLARISNLPVLESLTISGCSGLQDVSELRFLRHLRLMPRELTKLPNWLLAFARHSSGSVPETLTIVGREELVRNLIRNDEDWPIISGIGKVYGNLPDESPFFTYTKSTGILEAFFDRRDLVESLVIDPHQSNNRSPHIMLCNVFGRIARISMAGKKKWYSVALLAAVYQILMRMPTGYIDPVPARILFAFFAATACFIYFFSCSD
ncbi:hypothetical protein EJB05_42547, partial [Eragrostis curvula]